MRHRGEWMSAGNRQNVPILRQAIEVDVVPIKNRSKIAVINRCQRVNPVDARDQPLGLDLRQPTERDKEFLVCVPRSNLRACALDIAQRETEGLTNMP